MSDSFLIRFDKQGKADRLALERWFRNKRQRISLNRIMLELLHLTAVEISQHEQ